MRKFTVPRSVWVVLAGIIVFGFGVGAVAWHYRIYSWSDYEVFGYMEKECHPVWREFYFRRIGPGADFANVIGSTKPAHIQNYGDFAVFQYHKDDGFTGVGATAYKGRLVEAAAYSCCWSKTFFDIRTKAEKELFQQELEAHLRPIREQWDREMAEEKRKEAQVAPGNEISP